MSPENMLTLTGQRSALPSLRCFVRAWTCDFILVSSALGLDKQSGVGSGVLGLRCASCLPLLLLFCVQPGTRRGGCLLSLRFQACPHSALPVLSA